MNLMPLFYIYIYITVFEVFFQFYCSTLHAKLVEIGSSAENNFLKNHAWSLHKNGTRFILFNTSQMYDVSCIFCYFFQSKMLLSFLCLVAISKVLPKHLSTESYWIGLTDALVEGKFIWQTTQDDAVFSDWAPTEPNDAGHLEDCAALTFGYHYQWNDAHCSSKIDFICEKE